MPSTGLTTTPHHDLQRVFHSIRHLRSSSFIARPPRLATASLLPNRIPRISPHRTYSTTPNPNLNKQYQTIPTCPPSICSCAPMPSGLDIDYKRALNGTMPPYAQHVVISTGRDDWGRKIEDEDGSVEGGEGINFARSLRDRLGRGGKWFDPERPVLISNSSFPLKDGLGYSSVHVFPQNVYVPRIGHTDHDALVEQFIGPNKTAPEWDPALERKAGLERTPVRSPTILICGHNTRDPRCGILGPLLRAEFESYLGARKQPDGSWERQACDRALGPQDAIRNTKIALVSHIGGHAFAGNVIVYLPPELMLQNGQVSPLAGMGLWYGRVEPKHVWGIMETIQRGEVIEELLRGVHKPADMGGYGQEARERLMI